MVALCLILTFTGLPAAGLACEMTCAAAHDGAQPHHTHHHGSSPGAAVADAVSPATSLKAAERPCDPVRSEPSLTASSSDIKSVTAMAVLEPLEVAPLARVPASARFSIRRSPPGASPPLSALRI